MCNYHGLLQHILSVLLQDGLQDFNHLCLLLFMLFSQVVFSLDDAVVLPLSMTGGHLKRLVVSFCWFYMKYTDHICQRDICFSFSQVVPYAVPYACVNFQLFDDLYI